MRTDAVTGLALMAAGGAIAWEARGFPRLGGMAYGPDLFPTIAAAGMAACGALILLGARRQPAGGAPRERARWPAAALLGVVALFALLLRPLGFHLTAAGATFAAALLFGARPLAAALLAVILPVALHAVFYSILRVPLPWGALTPVAW